MSETESESETPQQRALRIVRYEVERRGGKPGEVTLSTPLRADARAIEEVQGIAWPPTKAN